MKIHRDGLLAFLRDRLGLETDGLPDDAPLFSTGRLDSFSMLDLILYIEAETGRRLRAREVRMDNLDSVARILGFVARTDETEAA